MRKRKYERKKQKKKNGKKLSITVIKENGIEKIIRNTMSID